MQRPSAWVVVAASHKSRVTNHFSPLTPPAGFRLDFSASLGQLGKSFGLVVPTPL